MLPLEPASGDHIPGHYGNTYNPSNTVNRGLMFQWGNYQKNRLDIGKLDLAILEDLGYSIKTYDGLALLDPDDNLPDIIKPMVLNFYPSNEADGISLTSNIVVTFNEAIQKGWGNIYIQKAYTGDIVESFDIATSNNLNISGSILTINPTNSLSINTDYTVSFESGSISDLAGNNFYDDTIYKFTTAKAADRVFNWGQSEYPDLFPSYPNPDSLEILGYYARIYSNGNALGEKDGNIYFYDGNSKGPIILVGTVEEYLPAAITAGL